MPACGWAQAVVRPVFQSHSPSSPRALLSWGWSSSGPQVQALFPFLLSPLQLLGHT